MLGSHYDARHNDKPSSFWVAGRFGAGCWVGSSPGAGLKCRGWLCCRRRGGISAAATISSKVAGRLIQLAIKAGDTVTKGTLLARIDAELATQQAIASASQADSARAQLVTVRKEFERQQQLFRRQYISQAALEQAEAHRDSWRAGQ